MLLAIATIVLSSCTRFNANYEQRKQGVREVLKGGLYFHSEMMDLAIDTTTNPNGVYKVVFCTGWVYPAYKVNSLTKLN